MLSLISSAHPVYFDCITGSLICSIALHVDGATGSSNNDDAHGWHHIYLYLLSVFQLICVTSYMIQLA